eukprot:scaffold22577_cov122-Cylindrotheca_fusiformis.AAC.13
MPFFPTEIWGLLGYSGGCSEAYSDTKRVLAPNGSTSSISACREQPKDARSKDWDVESGKGYYITGKLTTAIYRDDCLFDGDDPDQPIKGVRKYIGVAARLFDYKTSNCTLKSLDIVEDALVANWKLEATLRLPWKPRLPTMHGSTRYSFDDDGLIARHEESWDMPALEAFGRTFFPDFWCKGHSLSDSET